MKYIYFLIIISIFAQSCSQNTSEKIMSDSKYTPEVPKHFPAPKFPDYNPFTDAKAELGRYLFHEPLMVKDSSFPSCSHCMYQSAAFSNNVRFARGYNREPEQRNNMTLINSVYRNRYFWDSRGKAIEGPAYRSIFMKKIFASDTNEIAKRLREQPLYRELFAKAFGDTAQITSYRAALAIATYVRSLISGNSKYDKYINGQTQLFNENEKSGMTIFFSDRAKCSVCHSGIFFTDEKPHNTGVTTHYFDRGYYELTNLISDRGKFLTPTLRNVELTYPYMHDGYLTNLNDVIEHYNRGGYMFINKDTLMKPLNLTKQEKQDLISFLKTLTDWEFINNPKFSNPFAKKDNKKK